jgi:hypothetical protein
MIVLHLLIHEHLKTKSWKSATLILQYLKSKQERFSVQQDGVAKIIGITMRWGPQISRVLEQLNTRLQGLEMK